MPGLVGWLGCRQQPLDFSSAVAELVLSQSQTAVAVPHVTDGQLAIVHPDINRVGHGHLFEPTTQRLVAFWGEFYGPDFDRNETSADVCLELQGRLREKPLDDLARMEGSFVLFLQEPGQQLLIADRSASRPLYYMETGGGVVFSPELKTFARLLHGRPPVNQNAMVSFLVNGHLLSDDTYYQGVRLLRPGCFLGFKAGKISTGCYTQYLPASPVAKDLGIGVYREELAALLRAAVRKRSRGMATAIFPISGGYDSRGILGCVREIYSGPLCTVSWGTDEDDPQGDAAIGRKVAESFSTQHRFLRRDAGYLTAGLEKGVDQIDGANSDPFVHPQEPELIMQLRSSGHLTLFRGDECFGYSGPAESAMEALARLGICELGQYPGLQTLFHAGKLPGILDEQRQTCEDLIASCPEFGDWSVTKDWLYLQQRLFRSLNFSHYAKLTILEARNPWLDHDVFEFYARIPVAYRYDKMLYRSTLKEMFPDLMKAIPIAARNSLEPWGDLLRHNSDFLQYARQHLVESPSYIHEIWSREAIAGWIAAYEGNAAVDPLGVRLIGAVKPLVRKYLSPVYKVFKKRAISSVSMRAMPAHEVLGRLLILKLWSDKYSS